MTVQSSLTDKSDLLDRRHLYLDSNLGPRSSVSEFQVMCVTFL